MQEKRNLSIQEFLKAYGLSKSNFYRLLAEGKGPKTLKLGKRRLVPVAEAEAWMSNFEQVPQ